ncbi:hypothetical protein LTR96_004007 [Exophiala xenobiotica]|nr:hypothetical protein LTR96_004007 [Exophiala xenobiotica]KAK5339620.1 hypothetical protein LTR98_004422 [Exophiala xenobiotica]
MADSDAGNCQLDVTSPEDLKVTKVYKHPLYNIVQLGDKPLNPRSLTAIFFAVMGLLGIITYQILLWLNIRASTAVEGLFAAKVFALGQCIENMGAICDSLWRLLVNCIRSEVPRPTLRLIGDNVPTVDVFIVSCGEPRDIVLDTVKAALHIDYPRDKFRVILSDDGKDEKLQRACQGISIKYPNLFYWARVKPEKNHGYKAGNLNAAIRKFDKPAEFKTVFDADMIPEPGCLRALVPHALIDNRVGMVTCAQHHYNIPDNDPLYQANVTGPGADDGIRDSVNAAWCPGSGFIIRHLTWVDIGGFPEFSITEDLITSWMLHGHGWKISLVHEVMQWGIQPDGLIPHLKQRRRWWTGHIVDSFKLKFAFDRRLQGATRVQRIAMFHHCLRPHFYTVFRMVGLICTMYAMRHGQVVATPTDNTLKIMMVLYTVRFMVGKWSDIKSIRNGVFWNLRRRQATNAWLANHFTRDVVQIMLPGPFNLLLGFDVSGAEKTSTGIKERDAKLCPRGMLRRLWTIHFREGVLYHGALFVLFGWIIKRVVGPQFQDPSPDFWFKIITGVGFPGLGLIDNVPLYLAPVIYVMFPPTMPKRRQCMVYDQEVQLWRPAPDRKVINWTSASWWLAAPDVLSCIWLVFVLLWGFSKTFQGWVSLV